MQPKVIIISAPSGAGKSTIISYLLTKKLGLEFSVSATCRMPRSAEVNGKDYYFLTLEEFKKRIAANQFVEYEEVYPDCFYGTLKSEIERISVKGNIIIFDVDVFGGINLKKQFGDQALAIFISPPSVKELKKRLLKRKTDTAKMIEERVKKAAYEMNYANQFDVVIMNGSNLKLAKSQAEQAVRQFIDNQI